jgi:hypothetical protein
MLGTRPPWLRLAYTKKMYSDNKNQGVPGLKLIRDLAPILVA